MCNAVILCKLSKNSNKTLSDEGFIFCRHLSVSESDAVHYIEMLSFYKLGAVSFTSKAEIIAAVASMRRCPVSCV